MDIDLWLRGLVLGLTVAAAVGPISLLCIRRTLAAGFVVGLVSGLGVATADATYGGVAAFGLTAVTDVLVGAERILALVGGAFLVWLGYRTARSRPVEVAVAPAGRGLAGAYASILGLTLTNPMTIISFGALFAGMGLAGDGPGAGASVTLGVFAGSAAWWLALTGSVAAFRARLTVAALGRINVASGILVAGFGLIAVARGVAG